MNATTVTYDLERPAFNPPDCPFWAKEEFPEWLLPFRGMNGLDDGLQEAIEATYNGEANAAGVVGLDRYQANQFIVFRSETAEYLYNDYTSLHLPPWPEGYLPVTAKLALECTAGMKSAEEKVLAILEMIRQKILHPYVPPMGEDISGSRNLNEDQLFASGTGYCNEQARVFVRMCQATGVPARMVHFFYEQFSDGHTVAEFYNGDKWCLADATYFLVFRNKDGRLLSAAECHEDGENRNICREAYKACARAVVSIGEKLVKETSDYRVAHWLDTHRRVLRDEANCLYAFGIINYPLPRD